MQKKYCIVPKKNNMFWELVPNRTAGGAIAHAEEILHRTQKE